MVDNDTFGTGNLLCRMAVFADCVTVFLNLVSLAVGKEAVD